MVGSPPIVEVSFNGPFIGYYDGNSTIKWIGLQSIKYTEPGLAPGKRARQRKYSIFEGIKMSLKKTL